VILVDDGIATGATTRAALRGVRMRKPSEIVLAVPVAPSDTIEALANEADSIVCLESHLDFAAIGYFYADFTQVSDAEVIETLARYSGDRAGLL
jgi:predicted phosphoribosyltransferase